MASEMSLTLPGDCGCGFLNLAISFWMVAQEVKRVKCVRARVVIG